jgi:hypothetical protein
MSADVEARWQMLTLTMQHSRAQSLRELVDALFAAWRRVRSTRRVRAVFERRVTASIRALEITFGSNGWHPHVHLLLRTSDWSEEERQALAEEWLEVVPGLQARAVRWSTPVESWHRRRALYLTKLGAEVAGIGKTCKNGNETPWQLAERSLRDPGALRWWREYQETMHGRRLLVFDKRAKALLAEAPPAEQPTQEWRMSVFSEEVQRVAEFEREIPGVFWELLEACRVAGPDPPKNFRIALDDLLEWRPRRAA